MSGADQQPGTPAPRKRGPRPRLAQPPRTMTLEEAIAAAKLGERRAARLADYRALAAIHGKQPFAVIHGVAALDALASGAGIAMQRENLMDVIHDEVMAMDDELRALGVTPPAPPSAPQDFIREDQGRPLDEAA